MQPTKPRRLSRPKLKTDKEKQEKKEKGTSSKSSGTNSIITNKQSRFRGYEEHLPAKKNTMNYSFSSQETHGIEHNFLQENLLRRSFSVHEDKAFSLAVHDLFWEEPDVSGTGKPKGFLHFITHETEPDGKPRGFLYNLQFFDDNSKESKFRNELLPDGKPKGFLSFLDEEDKEIFMRGGKIPEICEVKNIKKKNLDNSLNNSTDVSPPPIKRKIKTLRRSGERLKKYGDSKNNQKLKEHGITVSQSSINLTTPSSSSTITDRSSSSITLQAANSSNNPMNSLHAKLNNLNKNNLLSGLITNPSTQIEQQIKQHQKEKEKMKLEKEKLKIKATKSGKNLVNKDSGGNGSGSVIKMNNSGGSRESNNISPPVMTGGVGMGSGIGNSSSYSPGLMPNGMNNSNFQFQSNVSPPRFTNQGSGNVPASKSSPPVDKLVSSTLNKSPKKKVNVNKSESNSIGKSSSKKKSIGISVNNNTSNSRDWNTHFQYLIEKLFDSEDMVKELRKLCSEFAQVAKEIGTIIISELFLPLEKKTIPPITQTVGGFAGGEKYVYNPERIFFKFSVDFRGLYGGTEFIMKV